MKAKELRWPDVACDASIGISTTPKPTPKKVVIESWVVREKNGELVLNKIKPYKEDGVWITSPLSVFYELPKESFPSITWESEPRKARIEITLIDEK